MTGRLRYRHIVINQPPGKEIHVSLTTSLLQESQQSKTGGASEGTLARHSTSALERSSECDLRRRVHFRPGRKEKIDAFTSVTATSVAYLPWQIAHAPNHISR
jgi:hypothetical protein